MLFNTAQFLLFLPLILALHYVVPKPWRRWLLLAASYYFYMCWNAKFISLLIVLTLIDYFAALWISRTSPSNRKLALFASLAANLGFLGFFKYYNFLGDTLCQMLRLPERSFFLEIILPMGISFHTFQSMSYVIDVYRGQQKPIRSLVDYALFISFFPQLVAGPIVRAREFFADFYDWHPPSAGDVQRGILMVILGLVKKMALADQFALIADPYFRNVNADPGYLTAWSATFAFAMQIFFDFSGYTDIAIGSAKLLGFHFPENFRRPYLASSITDFWRRWHMSLSRWLRDYLYISLGGNRGGQLRTYRNLLLTMLLGGLWHGASWNFVIWGGFHGALLGAERIGGVHRKEDSGWTLLYPFRALLTFLLVLLSWVFFRAATFGDAASVLGQMFSPLEGTFLLNNWQLGLVALSCLLAVLEEKLAWFERLSRAPMWAFASALSLILLFLELFAVTGVAIPFVYFQF